MTVGDCQFCGRSAGIFRKQHEECETRFADDVRRVKDLALQATRDSSRLIQINRQMDNLPHTFSLNADIKALAIIEAFEQNIREEWERDNPTRAWEDSIRLFIAFLESDTGEHLPRPISINELDREGSFSVAFPALSMLRLLDEGRMPFIPDETFDLGAFPFSFTNNEQLLYWTDNVTYSRVKTERWYVGESRGTRVYWGHGISTGSSKRVSQRLEEDVWTTEDIGLLAITTRHIYFQGRGNSQFRVRHDKTVSVQATEEDLMFVRDRANAKPETFTMQAPEIARRIISRAASRDTFVDYDHSFKLSGDVQISADPKSLGLER